MPWNCGSQRLTSSGAVSDASKPILIYGYAILSAATAAVPYFLNGTSSSAINFRAGPTTASQASVVSIPAPLMMPTGCYVSFDANTSEVTVFYSLQSVTS